ncbi:MAG TPA: peptidoglycan DD-metalloendopeptidase family protein, partial [Actinomycetota bacterium]|nr:peptidoglycan DD-metalloendopeptidase family protein [Actinomycetota bacterium]
RRRIEDLRRQADALAEEINQVESEIADTRAAIDRLRERIRRAQQRAERTQEQLDARAREAFQSGPVTGLEYILGATSLTELADRVAVVEAAARSDRQLIEDLQALQAELRTEKLEMQRLEQQLEQQRARLQDRHRTLVQRLADQRTLLRQLAEDRKEAAALVRRLEEKRRREIEAARRAREILLAARRALHESVPVDDGQPGPFYVCPVDPPRSYTDDFGAPRYSGGYHPHQGNDIFAPAGTPVRAPFPGTAVDASNGLGGISVKVYGAQGYVYNAHLSGIARLGPVDTGDVIGYVGNTGNAQGTSPHNHFEWHPGNGPAVNPYPYLNEVCR